MMWRLVVLLACACGDGGGGPNVAVLPDGGAEPIDATAIPPDTFVCRAGTTPRGPDCTNAPDTPTGPANTVCSTDADWRVTGWCIASVCRPACHDAAVRCEVGCPRIDRAGACYCL